MWKPGRNGAMIDQDFDDGITPANVTFESIMDEMKHEKAVKNEVALIVYQMLSAAAKGIRDYRKMTSNETFGIRKCEKILPQLQPPPTLKNKQKKQDEYH